MDRFAFEWLVPGRSDRLIHVKLLDRARPAPFLLAAGHGADKEQALLNLWGTLKASDAVAEAIKYVAVDRRAAPASTPATRPSDMVANRGLSPLPACAALSLLFAFLFLPGRDGRTCRLQQKRQQDHEGTGEPEQG